MKTRLKFCPVCQKQTPHRYEPISLMACLLLGLIFFPALILYVWKATRRADRTATCAVDHAALQNAREEDRLRSMVTMIEALRRADTAEPALAPRRGTGWMS